MKKKYVKLCLILLVLFIIWTLLVILKNTTSFDNAIYNFIIKFRSNNLDSFFKLITKLGNTQVIFAIVCVFLIITHNIESLFMSTIAIICPTTMQILKSLIKRKRPTILRLINQGGYSFPSGHAMISIGIYGFLIYYFYNHINNKVLRNIICSILFIIIILIGISRVYLGVHYPSDIIGGYLISFIILIIIINILEIIKNKE